MRFVASADWQLGKQANFLPEEARSRYWQARLDAVARIGEVAATEEAEFVVVAGDVFESNQLKRGILAQTFDVLQGFPVPVYLLPGNHDPLDAASIYTSTTWQRNCPENVHVLTQSGVDRTWETKEGERIELIAAPWFSKAPHTDLVREAVERALEEEADPGEGLLRVVIGHGAVSSTSPADAADLVDDTYLESQLRAGTIDFVVLGDHHSALEVAPRLWYPGTPEVTAEREARPGHVLVVDLTSTPAAAHVQEIEVGEWALRAMSFDVNSEEDLAQMRADLQRLPNKARTGIKLALTGTLTVRNQARLEGIIEDLQPLFARLQIWESHTDLAVMAEDEDFQDLGLADFALDAVAELQAATGTGGEDAQEAADALALLFRLVGEDR